MRAGPLRHHVRIESPAEERGPGGERLRRWDLVATDHVSIEPIAAGETERAGQLAPTASAMCRMRFRSDIAVTAKMRLVETDTGRVLSIEGVYDPRGRRQELVLLVAERPVLAGVGEGA